MLSAIVAVAAFAPPAARTWPHTARPVVQPLRAAQPLCKVRDPNDKVIYVGASPAATTHPAIRPATNAAIPPTARPAALRSLHRQPQRLSTPTTHPARSTASRTAHAISATNALWADGNNLMMQRKVTKGREALCGKLEDIQKGQVGLACPLPPRTWLRRPSRAAVCVAGAGG